MNALAELQKRRRPVANPANPANQGRQGAESSQDSQDSQGVAVGKHFSAVAASALPAPLVSTLKLLRARLLALAASEWIDAAPVHRLHDLDVAALIGLDASQLVTCLTMLADTAERHAGRVPAGHTAPVHCEQCGPVWDHPDRVAMMPIVSGWPRALGCPWCMVRKAGRYIPGPPVACEGCAHFTPDTINPDTGMGDCHAGNGIHYPMARHPCGSHSPSSIKAKKRELA